MEWNYLCEKKNFEDCLVDLQAKVEKQKNKKKVVFQ